MLREFWSSNMNGKVHPKDRCFLNEKNCLSWSQADATAHTEIFETSEHLHEKLHVNLYPQPFVGNVENASVYILFGNPGFAISDYADELGNSPHAAACSENLRETGRGFFPLLKSSDGTGAANYWKSRLNSLIRALSERLEIPISASTEEVVKRLALIESGAYHSKKFPGNWCDDLPSSKAARAFVHEVLLPKARGGEVLLFVWRRASFWGLRPGTPGVLYRAPEKAQLKNITVPERSAIVDFIASHAKTSSAFTS